MVQAIQVLRFHLLELEKVSDIFILKLLIGIHFKLTRREPRTGSEKYHLTLSNIISFRLSEGSILNRYPCIDSRTHAPRTHTAAGPVEPQNLRFHFQIWNTEVYFVFMASQVSPSREWDSLMFEFQMLFVFASNSEFRSRPASFLRVSRRHYSFTLTVPAGLSFLLLTI